MAALMTASMVLIEIPLMMSMYKSKKLNVIILAIREIKGLCKNIIASQQAEIDQMKGILDRMNR